MKIKMDVSHVGMNEFLCVKRTKIDWTVAFYWMCFSFGTPNTQSINGDEKLFFFYFYSKLTNDYWYATSLIHVMWMHFITLNFCQARETISSDLPTNWLREEYKSHHWWFINLTTQFQIFAYESNENRYLCVQSHW